MMSIQLEYITMKIVFKQSEDWLGDMMELANAYGLPDSELPSGHDVDWSSNDDDAAEAVCVAYLKSKGLKLYRLYDFNPNDMEEYPL
jgi:hypothetical protein